MLWPPTSRRIYKMSRSMSIDKVVNEVKVLVAELKKEHLHKNEPLSDDEPLVNKLCVRLENVFRFDAREKYSFMGLRKDYWNFICESVPKDDNVKHVQSIPDFKTNPGKGRAFLREALVQKSLADTLQRAIINERITKDYYGTNSVMRDKTHFQALIHTLYDLNAFDFELPHQGYDLDKGFPSFARKRFNSMSSRRSSISSVQSFQPDPLQSVRSSVNLIETVVNSWLGKVSENTENTDNDVSLLQLIDKLNLIREHINFLRTKNNSDIEGYKNEIEKLKDDKLKSDAYMEQRTNLIHDQYKSKISIDTAKADDNFKKVSGKLTSSQQLLSTVRDQHESELLKIKMLLEASQDECESLRQENKDIGESIEEYKMDLINVKETNVSYTSTNKILEEKISELRKINLNLVSTEKDMIQKNSELEQLLKIKETELNVVQDTFQKSTGHVVGSVEELKTQLSFQQNQTSEVLNNVCSTNEGLINESKALLYAKNELEFKLKVLEEKFLQESTKREETEKIVTDLKGKYTENMKYLNESQNFINDLSNILSKGSGNEDLDDVEDGLVSKSMKYNKEAALQKVTDMQKDIEEGRNAKGGLNGKIEEQKKEIAHLTQLLDKLKAEDDKLSYSESKCQELEQLNSKISCDVEIFNGKIYDMSIDIITLNDSLTKKQTDLERERSSVISLHEELEFMKNEKGDLEKVISDTHEKHSITIKEMSELSERYESLKGRQDSEHDSWSSEREALIAKCEELNKQNYEADEKNLDTEKDIMLLKHQIDELEKEKAVANELHEATKKEVETLTEDFRVKKENYVFEIMLLKNEADKLTQEREKENERVQNASTEVSALTEEWTIKEEKYIAEIETLQTELNKLEKQKKEKTTLYNNALVEVDTLKEEYRTMEDKYMSELDQNKQDVEDIKSLLVISTQEKNELWEKKEHIEQELGDLREQLSDRWVIDTDVSKCASCQAQFSLTRRKHHCRLCGQIFCNDCSNRWVRNNSRNRKKVRACHSCADAHEANTDKSSGSSPISTGKNTYGSLDDTISTINSVSDTTSILGYENSYSADNKESVTSETPNTTLEETHYHDAEDVFAELKDEDDGETHESTYEESCTGDFEILAAGEDPSNGGSFGENQQVEILPSDQMKSCLIPNCHSDSEDPANLDTVDIDIAAGYRVILPVLVPGIKMDLSWEFTSTPKDVGFGVAFKPCEEEGEVEQLQTIVPLSRYISHKLTIHGKMTIGNPGTYYLVFDNSYSRLTMKTVNCKVGLTKTRELTRPNQE